LPEPETPVTTTSLFFGISTLTERRLCSDAWVMVTEWDGFKGEVYAKIVK